MKRFENWAAILRRLGAFALCFALVLTVAVCMPVNACADELLDDDVEDGISFMKIFEMKYLANVTIKEKLSDGTYGPTLEDGAYLDPKKEYILHFDVDEEYGKGKLMPDGKEHDLLFDIEWMYYVLPEGLNYTVLTPNLVLTAIDYETMQALPVRASVTTEKQTDGTLLLVVTWDQESPGWPLLATATNARYELEVEASADSSSDVIELADGQKFYVDNTAHAGFTKTFTPEELYSKLTDTQLANFQFTLKDVYVAKGADEVNTAAGEKVDSQGFVRDAQGNIVYGEKQDLTVNLSEAKFYTGDNGTYYWYNFPQNLKPTGEHIVVEETAHPDTLDGYTWSSGSSLTSATSAEELTAGSERIVTLSNYYIEDSATLKITKAFGANSDITADNVDMGQIRFTVLGTKANDDKYEQTYSYADLKEMNWKLTLPAGTYSVTETSGFTNYDWTVTSEAGIEDGEKTTGNATTSTVTVGKDQTAEFGFTNTYVEHKGRIVLNKKVNGATLTDEQKASTTFTVKQGDTALKWDQVTANGTTSYTYNPNGNVTSIPYSAFADGSVTLNGLPVGTYTVEESTSAAVTGYKCSTTVSVNNGTAANGSSASVRVTKDSSNTVAFTNTYTENASIKVTKTVTGDLALDNVRENLKFTLQRKVNNVWTDVDANVSLTGSEINWSGLPFGTYRVVESATAVPNYSMATTVAVNPSDGATVSDNNKTAEFTLSAANNSQETSFTNTYTRKTTNLTIKKSLSGTYPDNATDSIKFTVYDVTNGNAALHWKINGTTYTYSSNESDPTEIPYAAEITLTGLPAGCTYKVSETTGSFKGYNITTTANGTAGTEASVVLTEGADGNVNTGKVEFVNSYRPVAEIGIVKSFTGVLSDDYLENEVWPKLRFIVSTDADADDGNTDTDDDRLYLTSSGAWVSVRDQAKEFTYGELFTSDATPDLTVEANKTYYIEELHAEVKDFTLTTYWSVGAGEQINAKDRLPQVTVTPGQNQSISFVNDYQVAGVVPAGVQLHHKTWVGLSETEEDDAKEAVRFELEYWDDTDKKWRDYDTYTLEELTYATKKYWDTDKNEYISKPIILPSGHYRLTEIKWEVGGYDHELFFTLVVDGKVQSATTELLPNKQVEFDVVLGETYQFSLANQYIPHGELQVKKVISGVEDQAARQKNISFSLTRKLDGKLDKDYRTTFSLGDDDDDFVDGVGIYTVSELPTGVYQMEETDGELNWKFIPYMYIVEETSTSVAAHTLVSTTVKVGNGEATTGSSAEVPLNSYTTASVTVEFTNTYRRSTGALTVTKVINGIDDVTAEMAASIKFQLKIDNKDGQAIKWNVANGENVYAVNGEKDFFTYADMMTDGKFTITGLNTGTYVLVETSANIANYERTTVFSVAGDGDASGALVIADEGDTVEVTVTNTYTPVGSLTVNKTFIVNGNQLTDVSDAMKNTTFTVKDEAGKTVSTFNLWDAAENDDGNNQWTLSKTIPNLPVGEYRIEETNPNADGYTISTKVKVGVDGTTYEQTFADSVPVSHGDDSKVYFENTYTEQGNLTVCKTFTGIDGSNLTDAQKNSIVFGLFEGNNLISAREGDAIASGEYQGWVSYANMSNGAYTWYNLDVSKQYYVKEYVIGEDNANTANLSPFYGYIHTATSWSGAVSGSTNNVPGVVTTGSFSVDKNGKNVTLTNAYTRVNELRVTKTGDHYSSDKVGDDNLPVWIFNITVENVGAATMDANKQTIIKDVFDDKNPEWFKLVDADGFRPAITEGDKYVTLEVREDVGSAEYVLTLKDGVEGSKLVTITYYLQPTDYETFQTMLQDTTHKTTGPKQNSDSQPEGSKNEATWTYTNTITYHPLPAKTDTASAYYYYNTDMVTKTRTIHDGDMTVAFTLNINPDALYIGVNDTLVVLDNMSDGLEVNMSSFKVVPEDLAAKVQIKQLSNDPDGNDLQFMVPNGEALTITYTATITEPTGSVYITNAASMEGVVASVDGKVNFEDNSSGSLSIGAVYIFKYGNTPTVPLEGATFALYECEDSDHNRYAVPVKLHEFTTNANGIAVIKEWLNESGEKRSLSWGLLYSIQEISAPNGYELSEDNDPIYFRIYENEEEMGTDAQGNVLPFYYKTGHVFELGNSPIETELELTATKILNGKKLAEDQFSFQLLDSEGRTIQSKKNAADGTVTFDKLTYTYEQFTAQEKEDGKQVHTYTIKEVNSNAAGYTYDSAVYNVTVMVSIDKDPTTGKITGLTATPEYIRVVNDQEEKKNEVTFTNTYTANGEATITGTKTVTNASIVREAFEFDITDGSDFQCTVTNVKDVGGDTAAINYPKFRFEVNPTATAGTTYDKDSNTIVVTVNKAEDLQTKVFTISEKNGGNASYTYDANVYTLISRPIDNGDGKLVVELTVDQTAGGETDRFNFTNAYYGSLKVKKNVTVNGGSTTGTRADGTYNFTVYTAPTCAENEIAKDKDGNALTATIEIKNGVSAEHTFNGVVPGTYWVKETGELKTGMTADPNPVEVTVSGDSTVGAPTAEITNNLGLGDLSLTKEVTGTESKNKIFEFTVAVTETANQTFACEHTGDATMSSVTFDGEGKVTVTLKADETFTIKDLQIGTTYTITEVDVPNDGYTVGTITNNGTGTITKGETVVIQQNSYSATGGIQLQVSKQVQGNAYNGDEQFGFQLKSGEELLQTKYCTDGKTATFDTISYKKPGTYTYTITEVEPAGKTDGMAYNTTPYDVEVVVTDNDDGTLTAVAKYGKNKEDSLTITNQYSAITFQPGIEKTLVGENLMEGTFSFLLTQVEPEAAEGEEPITRNASIHITPAESTTGTAVFKNLPVYHEDDTYVYEIVELKPVKTDDRTPGMTYSPEKVIYTVDVVRDEETGALSIDSESYTTMNKVAVEDDAGNGEDDDSAADDDPDASEPDTGVEGKLFTNVYKRPEGEAQIIVNKAMTGNEYFGDNEFAFQLTKYDPAAEDDTPVDPDEPVDPEKPVNPEEPPVPDTPADPDTPVEDDPVTNNIITPDESLVIGVDGTAVWTIQYDQPGTYYYTIQEILGGEEGVTYDDAIYYVTVVMDYLEDENGDRMSLKPKSVSYSTDKPGTEDENEGEPDDEIILLDAGANEPDDNDPDGDDLIDEEKPGLTITNKYSKVSFVPVIGKVVNGHGAPSEHFTFELSDGEGYRDTADCMDGEIAQFSEIVYHEPGEYTYTITELVPERKTAGMTYSDEVVRLTVVVEELDDETGTLTIDVEYSQDVITNKYTQPIVYDYKFSFTKKWQGGTEDSIDWTMYDANGNVVHKKFNKDVISENEWYYEAWFDSAKGYYIIEDVPKGYTPIYINVGEYADVTDRLYNGGTIVNYKVPETGDQSDLRAMIALLMASGSLLAVLVVRSIRRKRTA